MSFIYSDKNLIAELLKSAVEFDNKFNKKAQISSLDPNINVEYRNYLNLTKKLTNQLQEQYFPTTTSGPKISAKDTANMGVKDLANLGSFFDFLVNNQITVDGKRIVFGAEEKVPDPRLWLPVTAEQLHFMQETVSPEGQRQQFQADYYVNRELLSQYIQSVVKDISAQDETSQKFIKTMLNNLLQKINQIFKTELTTEYKPSPQQLPDNTQVDTLPSVLDEQQWGQAGTIPLTLSDLKSIEDLNAWFIKTKTSIKIGNKTETIMDQNFDHCMALKILHARAQMLMNRATPQNKFVAQAYLQAITQLAEKNNCNIQMSELTNQTQSTKSTTPSREQLLSELASLRPFNSNVINFNNINQFVDLYASLASNPQATSQAYMVKQYVHTFQNEYLSAPTNTIQLYNLTTTQFKELLKNPRASLQAVGMLKDIIRYAGSLYEDMLGTLQTIAPDQLPADTLRAMMQQVVPGGPQLTNINTLNTLQYNLQQEWNQSKK